MKPSINPRLLPLAAAFLLVGMFFAVWLKLKKPEHDEALVIVDPDPTQRHVHAAWAGWHDADGHLISSSNRFQPALLTLLLRNADAWLIDLAKASPDLRGPVLSADDLDQMAAGKIVPESPLEQRFNAWHRARLASLRLVLAGQVFDTIMPVDSGARPFRAGTDTWNAVVFRLAPGDAETTKWHDFIRSVGTECSGRVTVAIPIGGQFVTMRTEVNDVALKGKRFTFNLRPAMMIAMAWTICAGVMLLLIAVARSTGVLRDTRSSAMPPGQEPPWSLSRVVLAWWLAICTAGYLFLWAMTDDVNVLSGSGPLLLGINGATLLFSQFINRGTTPAPTTTIPASVTVPTTAPIPAVAAAPVTAGTIAPAGVAAVPAPQKSAGFIGDLISEGSNPEVSRVQMLIWNAVLGLVFIWQTLAQWKMPTFDPTLMTLLGISATTYLGFKAAPSRP